MVGRVDLDRGGKFTQRASVLGLAGKLQLRAGGFYGPTFWTPA